MKLKNDILKLITCIENEGFRGYDPYDALNSPVFRSLSFKQKYLRIFFIQVLKKIPFNFRMCFGIDKGYNSKALGLFLWGYAKLYSIDKKIEYLNKIEQLLGLLDKLKSKGYSGNCWGYNFDWQSRAFFLPKYTPTIVNSSFIGHALIDTFHYTNNIKSLEMAISIKDFVLNDLNRKNSDREICFSYTPIDKYFVHNANLLGSSLLIRLCKYSNDSRLKEIALASLDYSMKHQNEDGSWYYAEKSTSRWIDSFHTGFNLQSILYFLEEGYAKLHRENFEKGVNFYYENFFLPNGIPKYYHNKIYPIDIHSPAQVIVFFSKLGKPYESFVQKIYCWMLKHLSNNNGKYYFQKTKNYTNKISYIRWCQSWTFHALTEYYRMGE